MSNNIDEMKAKIAKLLAKAEGTTNEAERDAFTAKAETLMLRLGIARAELEAVGEANPEPVIEVQRCWRGNYSIVMVPFTGSIAGALGNITTLQSTWSAVRRYSYLIGHQSDVERLTQLLDSLEIQVMSALHRWQREHREERRYMTDMEKFIANRSFITGFGNTVASRLRAERKTEEATASSGAELVLVSKQARVDDWVGRQYPKLRKGRGGAREYDYSAYVSGGAAGRNADLGHKRTGGSREALNA